MKARIRDTEIYFDIDGAALVPEGSRMRQRPTAFLIHGGPGYDHTAFKARYARLKETLQVVYFDHRGQGRSARGNSQKYTLDENVEDMEALRHHLGLGPIVSIGASYGGMVGMAHAARYPGAVSHLILLATAAHAGLVERALQIVAERGSAEQREQSEHLFAGRLDTVEKLQLFFEVMGPLYALTYDPIKAKESRGWPILSPEALNRAWAPGGDLREVDLRPELALIIAPTLILAGRHDWICAPEFSEEIHRLIQGSDLRIFEESAHQLGADEPDKVLDAINGFLICRNPSRDALRP